MRKFGFIIGALLIATTLLSCKPAKSDNCIFYGQTFTNESGEKVAKFTHSQMKTKNAVEITASHASITNKGLVSLANRGIVFNKTNAGYLNQLVITISDTSFESAKLYYGVNPLPIENKKDLTLGENVISLSDENRGYFVIHNEGKKFNIESISITYSNVTVEPEANELKSIYINTANKKDITSLTTYVTSKVITDEYQEGLDAQVRVRGNSTAMFDKKPYRIKFDKKTSLFGYNKSKNYLLLADYLDRSKMHNYSAFMFSKLIRETSEFSVTPMHVKVYVNNVYKGIYLFCDNIDEKSEHLNIGQDNIWELSFNEINFYVDRDENVKSDKGAKEGETYIDIPLQNYALPSYCFELKYPEKEDFIDGSEVFHQNEWNSYVSNLRSYLTNICQKFVDYYHSKEAFSALAEVVDVDSLAKHAVIEHLLLEADHVNKSIKVFRKNGGKLQFGPCWDYDGCSYGFPFTEKGTDDPFNHDATRVDYLFEVWMYTLYLDEVNGKPLMKAIWDELTQEKLDGYVNDLYREIKLISYDLIPDVEKWAKSKYYSVFDNILFVTYYMSNRTIFLKEIFSNL